MNKVGRCSLMPVIVFLLLFSISSVLDFSSAHAASWQADFTIRVLSPKVKEISDRGKIYFSGMKVRIEPENADEIDLYDFEQNSAFRIFPKDHIFFKKPLSLAKRIKGIKEGWVPPLEPFREEKILMREDTFNGHPAKLYFVILKRNEQKAYLFRWVMAKTPTIPLRVIYHGTGRETIIVDFKPLLEEPPPDYFIPPSDYLSLNPF